MDTNLIKILITGTTEWSLLWNFRQLNILPYLGVPQVAMTGKDTHVDIKIPSHLHDADETSLRSGWSGQNTMKTWWAGMESQTRRQRLTETHMWRSPLICIQREGRKGREEWESGGRMREKDVTKLWWHEGKVRSENWEACTCLTLQ